MVSDDLKNMISEARARKAAQDAARRREADEAKRAEDERMRKVLEGRQAHALSRFAESLLQRRDPSQLFSDVKTSLTFQDEPLVHFTHEGRKFTLRLTRDSWHLEAEGSSYPRIFDVDDDEADKFLLAMDEILEESK